MGYGTYDVYDADDNDQGRHELSDEQAEEINDRNGWTATPA